MHSLWRREWSLLLSYGTAAVFYVFHQQMLGRMESPLWAALAFAWLFAVILQSAFAVVRHSESLASLVGEPFGTLILTFAITAIEVMMIAAVMLTGPPVSFLARDTMFAVVMIVFNGMAGVALLLGGLRYHEQTYNLQGANAFFAVIVPLAVIGLVLPNFTVSGQGPTLSTMHEIFLIFMSLALYGVFLAIQTLSHRKYFLGPDESTGHAEHEVRSAQWHGTLLVANIVPIILLSKQIALPIEFGVNLFNAPEAVVGFLVAVLVLSPESLAAVRAALANQIQRSINLLLGSVLASISLTIPAVLAIGLLTERTVVLGLAPVDTIMLLLTLGLSTLTFASGRTNVLLGAVHLLLFLAYLMLIFER
ncbi:MAG TPA: ionic transporter y4hA [Burkholderiales bacterium]|nr:ionic transporter y4hA [Burkholderiales bacterium]